VASQVLGWPGILDCIGSKKEMEELASVFIDLPWDRMKPLGSYMATEKPMGTEAHSSFRVRDQVSHK
jgi:hypothetical protein